VRAAIDLGQELSCFALDCAETVNDGEVDGVGWASRCFLRDASFDGYPAILAAPL
jgi:hypothetical protein